MCTFPKLGQYQETRIESPRQWSPFPRRNFRVTDHFDGDEDLEFLDCQEEPENETDTEIRTNPEHDYTFKSQKAKKVNICLFPNFHHSFKFLKCIKIYPTRANNGRSRVETALK